MRANKLDGDGDHGLMTAIELDKYMAANLHLLEEADMPKALELLLDECPPTLHEAVENMFLVNLDGFSPYTTSELLYTLAKARKGSGTLISQLTRRVSKDSELSGHLDATTLCQSLVSLNMAGVSAEDSDFNTYAKHLSTKVDELLPEEREVLS